MTAGVCGLSWGRVLPSAGGPAPSCVASLPAFLPFSFSLCQPVGGGNWILGLVSIWFSGTRHLQQFSSMYSRVQGSRAQEHGEAVLLGA